MDPQITTAFVVLSGVIAHLWRIIRKNDLDTKKRLTACEDEREDIFVYLQDIADCVVRRDHQGMKDILKAATKRVQGLRYKPPSDVPPTIITSSR